MGRRASPWSNASLTARTAGAVDEQVDAADERLGGVPRLSLVGYVELERRDPLVICGDPRLVAPGRVDACDARGE